uniref:Uncharacterized protein MANES_07G058100 n=1 Tax=Rhizophora mucronata TaxID=61149 RepID=A0A2P2MFM7_RHIMU
MMSLIILFKLQLFFPLKINIKEENTFRFLLDNANPQKTSPQRGRERWLSKGLCLSEQFFYCPFCPP